MLDLSIRTLTEKLANGDVTSVDLTKMCLDRIKQHDETLNSFITLCEDEALQAATEADARRKQGDKAPLLGLPIAHKDIFCTTGIKTSCGSKMLDNFISPYNATVVDNLAQAGCVMVGKTNLDEFAMGSSGENSFYGPSKNPWDLACVPGGSSSGSAVAVAARLVPAATGTDTGGSVRQPAALCGITGLKPTYGRVSRWGMIAFASSLDQGGLFAKSAEDCAYLLQAMAGYDEKDSTSVNVPVPNYTSALEQDLKGLKIGLPSLFFDDRLCQNVRESVQGVIDFYQSQGAIIETVELPHLAYSIPVYYIVAPAECSSNLARFDGVRYGYRCDNPKDLQDLYERSRAEGFGIEVKRRIMIGTYVLSAGYYDAYYGKAQCIRRLVRDDFVKAFAKVDMILGPTTPSTAFKIGEKTDDPVAMYLNDIYTIAVNLAGLPGISIPTGFINDMPIGAQLIAKPFAEDKLLAVANMYQQEHPWHTEAPSSFK